MRATGGALLGCADPGDRSLWLAFAQLLEAHEKILPQAASQRSETEREVPPKRPRDGGEDVPLRRKNVKTGEAGT